MISSFLKCMMVIFLIVLARTLNTVLTIVGKNERMDTDTLLLTRVENSVSPLNMIVVTDLL